MNKYLIFVLGVVSFLGINVVKADTYGATNFYNSFDKGVEVLNTYSEQINHLISMWEQEHTSEFPYYFISFTDSDMYGFRLYLHSSKTPNYHLQEKNIYLMDYYFERDTGIDKFSYMYSLKDNSYTSQVNVVPQAYNFESGLYLLKSNTKPIFYKGDYKYGQVGGIVKSFDFDTINVPAYESTKYNLSFDPFEIKLNEYIPTIESLYNNSYVIHDEYVEIDLNNYSYVALSLKDYKKEIKNNYSEYSNIYVKGQLCVTPVYNYGQTEKKDIMSGSKNQACSQEYQDFTIHRFYILQQDVKNHAIYYLKSYDTSKENIIKVNTNYFNVSYISDDNKDNPTVTIDGKTYPTLPYDDLTDTATKSEDEGYVSGVSCAVGDLNCYVENNPSDSISSIFDKPLEALKSVWSAIVNVFDIIKWFILLLPPTMQTFLYLSFFIAIVLGLIKVIL